MLHSFWVRQFKTLLTVSFKRILWHYSECLAPEAGSRLKFKLIPFVYVTLWRNYEMTTHFFRESPAAHYRCFPYGKGKVGPFPLHSSVFLHRGRNLQRQHGCKWHHTEASSSTYCQARSWFSLSGHEYTLLQPIDGEHFDSSASCFTSVWHRNPGVAKRSQTRFPMLKWWDEENRLNQ